MNDRRAAVPQGRLGEKGQNPFVWMCYLSWISEAHLSGSSIVLSGRQSSGSAASVTYPPIYGASSRLNQSEEENNISLHPWSTLEEMYRPLLSQQYSVWNNECPR